MRAISSVQPAARPARPVAPLGRMLLAQTAAQLVYYRRTPAFFVFSVALPVIFYAFLALAFGHQRLAGGAPAGPLIMASMGAYAVSSILIYNVGIGQAQRRGQKQDLLQRATPLPVGVVILAESAAAVVLSLVALGVLFAVAALFGGVRLGAGRWLAMAGLLVVGALPLMGLGLALGYSTGAQAAPALANLIYLPMAFVSGLFVPLRLLPGFVQAVGRLLPTYHYAQLAAYGPLGQAEEPALIAVLWLLGWSAVLFALAARAYERDRRRKFA